MKAHAAKNYVESERIWTEAARTDPSWAWPYYNLACTTALQGRVDEALVYLDLVASHRPDIATYKNVRTDRDLESMRARSDFEPRVKAIEEGVWQALEAACRACKGKDDETCGHVAGRQIGEFAKVIYAPRAPTPDEEAKINDRQSFCADLYAPDPEMPVE